LEKLNADELQVAQLEREVLMEEANYRKYTESLEQARIDRVMAQEGKSNISIVQPATLDHKPVKPNAMLNLAMGMLLGVAGGLLLAYLADAIGVSEQTRDGARLEREVPSRVVMARIRKRQSLSLEHEAGSNGNGESAGSDHPPVVPGQDDPQEVRT